MFPVFVSYSLELEPDRIYPILSSRVYLVLPALITRVFLLKFITEFEIGVGRLGSTELKDRPEHSVFPDRSFDMRDFRLHTWDSNHQYRQKSLYRRRLIIPSVNRISC